MLLVAQEMTFKLCEGLATCHDVMECSEVVCTLRFNELTVKHPYILYMIMMPNL